MAKRWVECSTILLLCCTVALFAKCNDVPDKTKQQLAPVPPAYQVYTVEIKGMKFVPDTITVKKGDEVVFVNRDMVAHCVTEEKSKAWTSGPLPEDSAYLLVAKESADYFCAIHKVMKGRIVVK